MAKILITRQIPGKALEKFPADWEIVMSTFDRVLTAAEIEEMGKDADAVITLLTDRWTGEMMDAMGTNLKVIANYAVGFDNIDIEAATERGIVVANTPSLEVDEAVAEFTWTLILSLSRRMVEGQNYAKKGLYWGWKPDNFLGRDVYGKTLGIIGLGGIGSMVARRAKGFNMKVLYNSHNRNESLEAELGAEFLDLDSLLSQSDYVTVHVPLNEETTHLINKERLEKMKQGSFLINTARGKVVDENALVEVLRTGHLAGAALDVHEREPQMNPELMQMENVILTPHIASATVEVREKMTDQVVTAIINTLKGEESENIVNAEVWSARRKIAS